ncbi:MAG: siphovirus Gp157 family protein [Candidatus Riflebacteria bacterium]|nr:siphovirus Gp157 family protein [Candidatus Riflebacteria bacterium]
MVSVIFLEELVKELKRLMREIRDGNNTVDRIQKNIQEMYSRKKTLLQQLQEVLTSENTKEIFVGKVRIRLIQDVDAKITNLAELPSKYFIEEKSIIRYPIFRKIKRKLLSGKSVPGAILEKKQRIEIRW